MDRGGLPVCTSERRRRSRIRCCARAPPASWSRTQSSATSRDGCPGMASTELTGGSDRQVLAELPLLGLLTPDVRELVVASFGPVRYEFGETIVAAGDPPDAFYVLRSGVARVLVVGDDGEEVSLNVLRAGDSFGEGGLLEGSPRTATVRAAGDVEALRLDASLFQTLARLQPR